MFNINYNPDVLSCLANLSSDEVFTPPDLVNDMLDLLPEELWQDKNATFLDPVCKSGVFLREIAKRLNEGLEEKLPDKQERVNHIFKNQLFGIAITKLTSLLSRRSVYCSKFANGKYSVCEEFDNENGNVLYDRIEHNWKNERCTYCGASKSQYDREESLETHAYQFIHTDNPKTLFDMRFDVIVGNPPYQLDTGGSGRQAKPIYHQFVQQAKKLNPRYLTMIIPSRWFAGGMGLKDFREEMLNDKQVKEIVDYVDARDCFPSVDIAGGVCYFLWEKDYDRDCKVVNILGNNESSATRPLNEFDILIRYKEAVSILRKTSKKSESSLTTIISSTRPFGLATSVRPLKNGNIHLLSSGGEGPYKKEKVTKGHEMINKWKVITSKTSHDHAGQPDSKGMRRVLSRLEVMRPNSVCTESYIVLGSFNSKNEAENLRKYASTKFVRFLISLRSYSQDITRNRFVFVPIQNFNEEWTDERLYKKYGLTGEEIEFIESMIRPMELDNE